MLLVFLAATVATATSFVERPFKDIVRESPRIVRGKAGESYANWGVGPDGTRRIYTFTEIQVDETLRGESASRNTIIVRELGGERDGVGMQVAGTAKFTRGEDVVIFLPEHPDGDGSYEVRGMMMGKYSVEKDADGDEVIVGAGLSVHESHGHNDTGAESPRGEKWTVAKLKKYINSIKPSETPQTSVRRDAPRPQAPALLNSTQSDSKTESTTAERNRERSLEQEQAPVDPPPRRPLGVIWGLGATIGVVLYWLRRRNST